VDAGPAVDSAMYRSRYRSKTNAFSYDDGIVLATALFARAEAIVTTDPRLLGVSEIRAYRPSAVPAGLRSLQG